MPLRRSLLLLAAGLLAPGAARAAASSLPVKIPPPRPKREPVPPRPTEDSVWIPGDWRRLGGTWVWSRGRYVTRPAPGYRWVRGAWEQRPFGWIYRPGGWAVDPVFTPELLEGF